MFIDFRERGRKREGGRERNINQLLPFCTPPHSLGVCPGQGCNLQPHDARDSTPTNWATQPRLNGTFYKYMFLYIMLPSLFFFTSNNSVSGSSFVISPLGLGSLLAGGINFGFLKVFPCNWLGAADRLIVSTTNLKNTKNKNRPWIWLASLPNIKISHHYNHDILKNMRE